MKKGSAQAKASYEGTNPQGPRKLEKSCGCGRVTSYKPIDLEGYKSAWNGSVRVLYK